MPDKSPDIWAQIWTWAEMHFANHNAVVCGVVIAFFASLLKSFLYGRTDTARRVLAEALLCSVIAGSCRPILEIMGWGVDLITPIGAAVGLVGTSAVRQIILKFLNNKVGDKHDHQ